MNPRKLFNIILKIFGLFFLREIINSIPQLVSSTFQLFAISEFGPIVVNLIIELFILGFYTFIVIQLLFKTNKFIDILKLDQGFSEEQLSTDTSDQFLIGLSSTAILTIALIVLGGYILTNEIPDFCRQFYLYFNQNSIRYSSIERDASYMIISAAKIIIGLLILGERKRIVDFFENRKDENSEEEFEQ